MNFQFQTLEASNIKWRSRKIPRIYITIKNTQTFEVIEFLVNSLITYKYFW